MGRLVVQGVMGGGVCGFGGVVVVVARGLWAWDFSWWPPEGGLVVVCVGGGIAINRLVGAAACCVCGLVLGGRGGGGLVWGWHCWLCGGRGWVSRWLGVCASHWVVWVLRVRTVRSLRSLAGCGAKVRVGGGCMGVRMGMWSVGNGWLPVDGASWYGVWVGGLLVVVGCSYYPLVLLVCVCGSPRVHGGVRWSVCCQPV